MTFFSAQLRGKFEGMVRTRNKIYQMIAAAMNRRFPNAQPKSEAARDRTRVHLFITLICVELIQLDLSTGTLEIKRRITCLVERVRRGGGDKYPPDHWHNVLTREYLNWHPTSVPSSIDGSPARGRTSTSRRRRSSRTTRGGL